MRGHIDGKIDSIGPAQFGNIGAQLGMTVSQAPRLARQWQRSATLPLLAVAPVLPPFSPQTPVWLCPLLPRMAAGSGRLCGVTVATGLDVDGLGLLFMRPVRDALTRVKQTAMDSLRPPAAQDARSVIMDARGE